MTLFILYLIYSFLDGVILCDMCIDVYVLRVFVCCLVVLPLPPVKTPFAV
jgi:hypothetical protein